MRRAVLTFIAALIVFNASAQLTPEEYRNEVVDYSWVLKGAYNTIAKSDETVAYTRKSHLPNLSASGRFGYNLRHYTGSKDWSLALEPHIIQTIYGGGVTRAEVEKAELASMIARADADNYLLEVCYAADYAYWNLWAMKRYYDAMEQYVDIIEREAIVIDHRYREGYIPKGDKLMMEARLSEAQYELTTADQNRLIALHNLNILRGTPVSDMVTLANISPDSMVVPRRIGIERVREQRPDYAAIQLAELVASAALRSTRGAYNPKLVGGATGAWRTYTPNASGKTYLDGVLYLELSLPIYHFGERRKATAISRAEVYQSEINTATLSDTITKEESNAWTTVVESRAQMSAAARSLRIASESLDISTYAYNEGEVSIVELIQAQISWIQIYTNAIDSEYNYQIALSYYRRVVGDNSENN